MNELAALPVRAVAMFMELLAQLRLITTGHVLLLLQLLLPVGKGTLLPIGALLFAQPTLAEFCFNLYFVVLRHYSARVLEGERVVSVVLHQVRSDAHLALNVLANASDSIVEALSALLLR